MFGRAATSESMYPSNSLDVLEMQTGFCMRYQEERYETCGGRSGEVFGSELQRSVAAAPAQKSPGEGFGKDEANFAMRSGIQMNERLL